jgi:hypothetical protein
MRAILLFVKQTIYTHSPDLEVEEAGGRGRVVGGE